MKITCNAFPIKLFACVFYRLYDGCGPLRGNVNTYIISIVRITSHSPNSLLDSILYFHAIVFSVRIVSS